MYMDCNSIIYDAVRLIDFTKIAGSTTAMDTIIGNVILKIEEYIRVIGPTGNIMIAFDGVAPVAKLEQQRNRRYKSWYQGKIANSIFNKTAAADWNTTAITPGTVFMKELNSAVQKHFLPSDKKTKKTAKKSETPSNNNNNNNNNNNKIIVSTSDEFGEGEHKIFQYIRSNVAEHALSTTVIYGLDADLIMLSINHMPVCPNIYLFRETPEFIKSIDNSLEPNETYFLDIPELMRVITTDMNNGTVYAGDNRIYDYIFLCFFLGNDFMPHFPAANIRTGGTDKLLNAYKATMNKDTLTECGGTKIIWKNVRKLVAFLAEQEEEFLKSEAKLRDRREKNHYPTETPEQKHAKFEAMPTYERQLEKYINPFKLGWQERYYKTLHKMDNYDEGRVKQISLNYLEGLEWTMKYYTTGCADWRWCYHYNYPPLFKDLLTYIPYFDRDFIVNKQANPVIPLVQLCYVLPNESLQFLPEKLWSRLKTEFAHLYPTDAEFVWAYCKYFWESHVELPDIDIGDLERIVGETLAK